MLLLKYKCPKVIYSNNEERNNIIPYCGGREIFHSCDKLIDSNASCTVIVLNARITTHPNTAAIWIGTISKELKSITHGITRIESHQYRW